MTSINYTADAATDVFTSTAHGLVTGDGPATTLVAGASLGGVDSTLDYWVIRIDANTYKLATSSANALAGTPVVNVTVSHGGVLGIGLPYRRARSYAAQAQVKSVDLNAFQDAERSRMHGSVPCVLPPSAFTKYSGAAILTAGQWVGVCTLFMWLPFDPLTLIDSITWGYNRAGAGTMTLTLGEIAVLTGASSGLFAPAISAGTGYTTSSYGAADIIAAGANALLPANSGWALQIDQTNAANVFGGVRIHRSKAA